MELENKSEEPKLIFGLSPKATFINAIVLTLCAALFWSLKFSEQFTPGLDYANLPDNFEVVDNVPWYYDMITYVLGIVLAITWVEYKFNIQPGDFSWRSIKYKCLYCVAGPFLLKTIAEFCFLSLILSFK